MGGTGACGWIASPAILGTDQYRGHATALSLMAAWEGSGVDQACMECQ